MSSAQVGSTPTHSSKLYVVGRRDLPTGLRTAQIGHALIAWVLARGQPPDNLVVLEVADEPELASLLGQMADAVPFCEPDLDGQLTAFAVGPEAARQLSQVRLMR